ncbi:chemotaxis protein CheW [Hyalangium versicolor]|uniref:chemotaxis protein CheW n=1 Tax=Hyalangium versicolor TaxID=2861190 RepID=UPI001CCC9E6F|nr:chemotaxis protein CheW [Hyalangium versicolor]
MNPTATAPVVQYLSFFVAGEEYALSILQVREIIEYDTVTRVPSAPVWVRGVTNLRGSVLPVIDLSLKLGFPPSSLHRRSCVVVVEVTFQGEKLVMGVMADAVGQVLDLGPGDVEPPPAFGTPIHADYLLGMGRAGKKFILLLDIDRVLNTQEIRAASAAASEPQAPPSEPEPPSAEAGASEPQVGG